MDPVPLYTLGGGIISKHCSAVLYDNFPFSNLNDSHIFV